MNENLIYPTSMDFVENYLSTVYRRQVADLGDTAWCPEWFRHAEAAVRLDAVWGTWEYLRQDGATGLSVWLVDHADPHMHQLIDRRGTFRYCSVRAGHRDTLPPLPAKEPPAGLFDGPGRNFGDSGTAYRNVAEFVENYLRLVYRRQVTDRGDTAWCPEWWRHDEAVARLGAVWRAWEYSRLEGATGISLWFIDHADRHMRKLLSQRGPFRYCGTRSGHRDLLRALPLQSPPAGLFETSGHSDDREYADVVEFVERYLGLVYRRQVHDRGDTMWCPQWWCHSEAVVRLEALWRSWEHLRRNSRTGLSHWFLDHADPHMYELMDQRGPFKYCSARNGHRDLLMPLPVRSAELDIFTEPTMGEDRK